MTHEGFRFTVKERSGLRISQLQVQVISSTARDRDDEDTDALEVEEEPLLESESEGQGKELLSEAAADTPSDDMPEKGAQ